MNKYACAMCGAVTITIKTFVQYDKEQGLTSWLSFVVSNCEFVTFPIGTLGQDWCGDLIVSIPDLRTLTYFNASFLDYDLCLK